MIDAIYLFNSSELRSRLQNYKFEIKRLYYKGKTIFKRNNNISINIYLSTLSNTYALYYSYYKLLKLFVKYTSDEVKYDFVINDIKNIYCNRTHNEENKNPYKTRFMNNKGQYDVNSFDKFMNFYIEKINDIFLFNATNMSQDLLNF